MNLQQSHPALAAGRTIFLKSIVAPAKASRMLQPASTNRKLGGGKKLVTKGKWKSMPMYQLLLEERATCPRSCQQWSSCYGSNMYMAKRIDHRNWTEFKETLNAELDALAVKHDKGFVVRLHVLGDFFSTTYVQLWSDALARHPQLRVFGYTHRWPQQGDGIGEMLEAMNDGNRCWIRFSDRGGDMSANVDGEGLQCPEQTGKTKSCLTCGLCWSSPQAIRFITH